MKTRFFLLTIFLFAIGGCDSNPVLSENQDAFSIYLVKESNQFYTEEKLLLKDLVLEIEPLLSVNSIEKYNWENIQSLFPRPQEKI